MRFVSLLALLLLCGCQSSGTITLPLLPPYEVVEGAKTVPSATVAAKIWQLRPGTIVQYFDDSYSIVSYDYLQKFIDWEWRAVQVDGLFYTPESFDCDDFAFGFEFFFHVAAGRAHLKSSPLVARVRISLPDGTQHMLNGVATDRGIYIIEPQPAAGAFRATALSDYKNTILGVYF